MDGWYTFTNCSAQKIDGKGGAITIHIHNHFFKCHSAKMT